MAQEQKKFVTKAQKAKQSVEAVLAAAVAVSTLTQQAAENVEANLDLEFDRGTIWRDMLRRSMDEMGDVFSLYEAFKSVPAGDSLGDDEAKEDSAITHLAPPSPHAYEKLRPMSPGRLQKEALQQTVPVKATATSASNVSVLLDRLKKKSEEADHDSRPHH